MAINQFKPYKIGNNYFNEDLKCIGRKEIEKSLLMGWSPKMYRNVTKFNGHPSKSRPPRKFFLGIRPCVVLTSKQRSRQCRLPLAFAYHL